MNKIDKTRLSKEMSTRITEDEHTRLTEIARYLKWRGYITKANISEAARFLLRGAMEWARVQAIQSTTKGAASGSRNSSTDVGNTSASNLNKIGNTDQRSSQGGGIFKSTVPSIGRQQSGDLIDNSIVVPSIGNYNEPVSRKTSTGSNNARNQTTSTSAYTDKVGQLADSEPSRDNSNLSDVAHWPFLEFMFEYAKLLKQIPRPYRRSYM